MILFERAKDDGQIKGIIPHLVDDGLSILQYTNNTLFLCDFEQAKNMKLLLSVFLTNKSEIFCFGEAK